MHRFAKRFQFPAALATTFYRHVATLESIKGQWQLTNTLSPQIIQRLQTSVLVTSTGASTRIEGSQLSDQQVQDLYQQQHITRFKTRDEQEVGGYIEVLQTIFEQWRHIPLSENTILGLHQQMLQHAVKDARHRGSYKFGPNRVEAKDHTGTVVGIIFDPTPPYLVAKEMHELIDWTRQALSDDQLPALFIIANFVFEFLAIHPFQDGNGRLSRLLTNLMLLQAGFQYCPFVSHEKIIEDNKADYYLALNQTQQHWKTDNEDITPWLRFFFSMLETQGQQALQLMTEQPTALFLSDKQNQIWNYIQTVGSVSRGEIIRATDLNSRTVDHTLKKLLNMRKLARYGQGRATRYRLMQTI
ncbi:MAG: Fic family protein [Pseudomonadota bacterium]